MGRILKQWILILSLTMALTACGFYLRGLGGSEHLLPFHSITLIDSGYSIDSYLKQALNNDQRIQVLSAAANTKSATQADAVITITNESQEKNILSLNIGGKISEYELVYHITAQITLFGERITPDINVTVRRTLPYSDSAVLGKQQEETLLWNDTKRDAAEQILMRLSYLKPPANAPIRGPQSLKPTSGS